MTTKNKNKETEYYIWADEPVEPAEISRTSGSGDIFSQGVERPETTPTGTLPHYRKVANFIVNFSAAAVIGLFLLVPVLAVIGFLTAALQLSDLLPLGSYELIKFFVPRFFALFVLIVLPAVIAVKDWNNDKNFIQHFRENF